MCRRLLLACLGMIFSFSMLAQKENSYTIPDYNEIKNLTADKGSAFYYENLLKRYSANDTNLNLRDYRMLYFGYFFQPGYSTFYHTAEADSIKMLLGAKDELSKADWEKIIQLGEGNLRKNPFDLKGLNVVWIGYRKINDSASARIYFDKLKKLVQTILSTGDGLSETTAFHVLNVSHEYDILNILGYEYGGNQKLTDSKCDYLSLKINEDNIAGLYFNVNQIFLGYQKKLSSKAP